MADTAITGFTVKTDVTGEEVLPVVDLREALAANQNKKMTIDTLFGSIITHNDAVLVLNEAVVYL